MSKRPKCWANLLTWTASSLELDFLNSVFSRIVYKLVWFTIYLNEINEIKILGFWQKGCSRFNCKIDGLNNKTKDVFLWEILANHKIMLLSNFILVSILVIIRKKGQGWTSIEKFCFYYLSWHWDSMDVCLKRVAWLHLTILTKYYYPR